jgi:hypothetical protein
MTLIASISSFYADDDVIWRSLVGSAVVFGFFGVVGLLFGISAVRRASARQRKILNRPKVDSMG